MTSLKRKKTQSGFTLIELLIVVIIVAVLAAVGAPLLQGNVQRAIRTEADAGIGSIRNVLRGQLAENNNALPVMAGVNPLDANINFNADDLLGHYYDDSDYTITSPGVALGAANTFCIGVTGNTAARVGSIEAPASARANGLNRSMNEQGSIFNNNNCTAPAVNN